MKTIEERAKEWGEHIVETTPYDVVDGKDCVLVEDRNIADVAEESYIAGATEQKAIDDERIAELEKEKALLILEVHNKNKRIAELKAMEE